MGTRVCLDAVAKRKIPLPCPCRQMNCGLLDRSLVSILNELSWLHIDLLLGPLLLEFGSWPNRWMYCQYWPGKVLNFEQIIYFGLSLIQRAVIAQSVYGLGYGLDDRSSRFRFPAGAGNFSLHHRVQNGSGGHPFSYLVGTRGPFPGGKVAGTWSWPLTSI
jgi:hypothetical protein